jgi:hypothetical protein
MKRCAVQLGIGLDVYSAGEYTNPSQPDAPVDGPVQVQQSTPVQATIVVEAKSTPVSNPNLTALNKRLEDMGYKSVSKKVEFVSMKTGMPISTSKWEKLTDSEAQMLIAVLKQKLKK